MGWAAHPALIRACAHLRRREGDDGDAVPRVTRFPLRLLAERIDNPERLDSEATFAALRGVNPVERSSGGRAGAVSTAVGTGRPMRPSTGLSRPASASTHALRSTSGRLSGSSRRADPPLPSAQLRPRFRPSGNTAMLRVVRKSPVSRACSSLPGAAGNRF
ncbi:transposase [Streptomyces decoyicus]|uniref:transposase n=1 Tax=Streptomyces decoyicus TaxID=249567 RepID=UPI003633751B